MEPVFTNPKQQRLFTRVISEIGAIGYQPEYLLRDYSFKDWFVQGTPERRVPLAAFGRRPFSYDSACLAVVVSDGKSGRDLVMDFRALGAPIAFEVQEDVLAVWRIGRDTGTTQRRMEIVGREITKFFREHSDEWSAKKILRAKNITSALGPKQLDFIDLGLIPALEFCVREKLDRLLRETVQDAQQAYKLKSKMEPDSRQLFRLVFRMLAAKVLHDRKEKGFESSWDPTSMLNKVGQFYPKKEILLEDLDVVETVGSSLSKIDFRNLSVEVLAYIYEKTLVDEDTREELGIHSTPSSIARYIVHQLPIEDIPQKERMVVEPCCGHSIFLVAALQRLRELLPDTMTGEERHQYFVKMLSGFESDAFALEVGKLCLMLADLPNHDGWNLYNKDIFASRKFIHALRESRIVLCNPPFEDFSAEERGLYKNLQSFHKPVELLYRVLDNIDAGGLLGFVLPQKFLDGRGYKKARKTLAERYEEIELVSLPDRIFSISQHETALLIARKQVAVHKKSRISFTFVDRRDRQGFLREYNYSWRAKEVKDFKQAETTLAVPDLAEIWKELSGLPKVGDEFPEIHRGIEWKKSFAKEKRFSEYRKKGFAKGYGRAERSSRIFNAASQTYLNCEQANVTSRNVLDYRWENPKVFLNARRISRGSWRYAAFLDYEGVISTKNFIAVWGDNGKISLECLCAILNNPLANAFVGCHERGKDNPIGIIKKIPLPELSVLEKQVITRLVHEYMTNVESRVLHDDIITKDILLQIDALVLKGYDLAPRLERKLLDYFNDESRPTPFEFNEYIPESFIPYIPLWMYISTDFKKCTAQNLLNQIPQIKDPVLVKVLEEVE